jgi:hypothetical protein
VARVGGCGGIPLASYPLGSELEEEPWAAAREESAAACAADDDLVLSWARRLALCAALGIAVILLMTPAMLAAWSMLDPRALDVPIARLDQVSGISDLLQLGRFALVLLLAIRLTSSSTATTEFHGGGAVACAGRF